MAVGTVAPGRLIAGRYRLENQLGRGGMAVVYRAHDEQLDRDVALKLVDAGPASDEEFSSAFLSEARAAASLRDPGVVTIFDVGAHEGRPFIVMELLEGGDLRALLRARGRLGPREAGRIALGVARALAAVHASGLIHCDVKPHNVLLTLDGQPKLADFGVSRLAAASPEADATEVVGTAPYLSPEQVRGESLDPRTDEYALGILLYELLAGQPPFSGGTPDEVAIMRLRARPRPIRQLLPEVPLALADVVDRALEPDPERRFRNAAAMAEALAAALGDPADSPGERGAAGGQRADGLHAATTRVVAAPVGRPGRPTLAGRLAARAVAVLSCARLGWPRTGLAAVLLGLTVVALAVSRRAAAETVAVPSVAGMRFEQAAQSFEAAGLRPIKADEPVTLDTPRGVVVTQEPLGGQSIKKGEQVRLTVSRGIAVPNFVGQRWDDVKPWMDQNGWPVGRVRFVVADQRDFGKVVAQQPGPEADAVADKQSTPIDINVAGPPEATRTGFPSGPAQQAAPPPPHPGPGRGEQAKPEAKPEKKKQGG